MLLTSFEKKSIFTSTQFRLAINSLSHSCCGHIKLIVPYTQILEISFGRKF